MTDTAEDDDDLRAAEYVLGVMEGDDASLLRAEAARNPALARAISAWEARLAPLADTVAPVVPPDALWSRIEDSLNSAVIIPFTPRRRVEQPLHPLPEPAPSPASDRNAAASWLMAWKAATAATAAVAAVLLAVVLWPAAPKEHFVASLTAANTPAAHFVAATAADGSIILTGLSHTAKPAGKDLELWALPAGAATPIALGVIPAGERYVVKRPDLAVNRTQLMVSLEPLGGSPTGLPTGPVLYAGTLVMAD